MDGDDTRRKLSVDLVVCADQNNAEAVIQMLGQLDEDVKALSLAPIKGDSQQDELVLAAIAGTEIALGWLEDREIDAVVDHLDGIVLQKGLLDQSRKPMGGGDDGKVRHAGEPLFLQAIHVTGIVDKTLGVFPILRAMMTARLPFVAFRHGETGTMAGKGPAIMEGPDDGNVVIFDITKQ